MIPLLYQEVVKRYCWLEEEEFTDILAIGNALPGLIITKMAGYIGYRVGGVLGCINTVLAVILPMLMVMVLLLGLFKRYQDLSWVYGMGQAVVPVVMIMMAQLTWDFWSKSRSTLGGLISLGMIFVSGGLIYFLGVHPAWVVGALLVAALAWPTASAHSKEPRQ